MDHQLVDNFVQGRKNILRGTTEWDDREDSRVRAAALDHDSSCCCKSYGSIADSNSTRGKSSLMRTYK